MNDLLSQVRVDLEDFHETTEILAGINEEVQRQEVLWGTQGHPMLSNSGMTWVRRGACRSKAQQTQQLNDANNRFGRTNWFDLTLEELYEAFAADSPKEAIEELTQLAALAVSSIKSINRYGLAGRVSE